MSSCCDKARFGVYFISFIGTFLIVAFLVWAMQHYTAPEPVDAGRAAERLKNLQDVSQAAASGLATYGWVNEEKGVVRLPVEEAMAITVREWQEPEQAREQLLARFKEANPPPPPPEPEAPSPFE